MLASPARRSQTSGCTSDISRRAISSRSRRLSPLGMLQLAGAQERGKTHLVDIGIW